MPSPEPLTVVIVSYYSRHLLPPLLQDIDKKIPGRTEVIIVNNGHEDLHEFSKSQISVITPHSNLGYGGGLNLATAAASNNILLFLNPDVRIETWSLAVEDLPPRGFVLSGVDSAGMQANRFPGFVSECVRYLLEMLWSPLARPFKAVHKKRHVSDETDAEWVTGGFMLTSKKTMQLLDGFDSDFFMYYEDTDLCLRAKRAGIPVILTPKVRYSHDYGRSTSDARRNLDYELIVRSIWQYHTKHHSKARALTLMRVLHVGWFVYSRVLGAISLACHSERLQRAIVKFTLCAQTASEVLKQHTSRVSCTSSW